MKYSTEFLGENVTIEADFSNASSGISVNGKPSKYCVAYFAHSPKAAMMEALSDIVRDNDEDPDDFMVEIADACYKIN